MHEIPCVAPTVLQSIWAAPLSTPSGSSPRDPGGVRSPLEAFSAYHGQDWSPERLAFHQNLETFAERVGLIVALQANGKISQEKAYAQIKQLWAHLKNSKGSLLR